MDYEKKTKYYMELKNLMDKVSEIKMEEVEKKIENHEELKAFLADNFIFVLEDGIVKKKKNIDLIVFKLTADKNLETKIADLRNHIEEQIGEVAYLRFLNLEGHLVVLKSKAEKFQNFKTTTLKFDDNNFHIHELTTQDKKDFSVQHGNHLEGILRARFGRKINFEIDGLLSHKKGIYLGTRKFKSLQEIKSIFTKLIKGTKVGEKISEEEGNYLKDLMKYHDAGDKKLANFDHFTVDVHPQFTDTKCFFVVRKDGTKEDFSYVKCMKEISKMIK